jgi:type IX secretion system PorP/SprF family membrane protein
LAFNCSERMKKGISTLIMILLEGIFSCLKAQDPQFSQFYAAPIYINPALTGSANQPRFNLNYRNQWPNLEASFETYSASFDLAVPSINSGFGLIMNSDKAVHSGFRSQDVGLTYAYELSLNTEYKLRAGMQVSYFMRDYDFSNFIFGTDISQSPTFGQNEPLRNGDNVNTYFNVSSGLFFYSGKYWAGLSLHNMNRPNQALSKSIEHYLPVHYSLQLGATFPMNRFENWRDKYKPGYKERSFSTALLYKKQRSFDQLDLGVYMTYEPLVIGIWYRGLPVKKYEIGVSNHEALIGLFGVKVGGLAIGYSYDFTISALGTDSGGAHELSLRYLFEFKQKRGVKQKLGPSLPCPRF